MKTKLTLSVDRDLVLHARRQARKDGRSVSAMFSNFLLVQKLQIEEKATPSVAAMVGILKRYNIDDSKAATRSAYAKKHIT